MTLFKRNKLDLHEPVTRLDCYLDQNSFIQIDAEQNLLPTETPLVRETRSLRSTFKKPLISGDTNDITLHADTVIKVCFIWETKLFRETGMKQETKRFAHMSVWRKIRENQKTEFWEISLRLHPLRNIPNLDKLVQLLHALGLNRTPLNAKAAKALQKTNLVKQQYGWIAIQGLTTHSL